MSLAPELSPDPADRAIARMRSPHEMHIICIDVTNKCDLDCSNCTRLLANQTGFWEMTPDNFRVALRSLAGFSGVIAMIGGNPCLHRNFEELCRIFVEEIPVKRQRGLWSNNVFRHQAVIRDSFGFFNLNPHNDPKGIESLEKLRDLIPGLPFYTGNSMHAPLLTAVRDLTPDPQTMWQLIEGCDINRHWSASIVQNKGELRAYFCEVAASFDLARGEDHGHRVTEGWWRRSIAEFADQVKRFCPGCGVPARLQAHQDDAETDSFTRSNADLVRDRFKGRPRVSLLVDSEDAHPRSARAVTDYHQDAQPTPPPSLIGDIAGLAVSVVIPCYNANDTLRDTLLSVLAQDEVSFEILVVDDASQQDPALILQDLTGPIRLIRMMENRGAGAARNAGLYRARGRYVCFLDSDDQYAPGFFAEAVRRLDENNQLVAISTGVELFNSHRPIGHYHYFSLVNAIPSNIMTRTALARLIGGFPEDVAFRGESAGEDVCYKTALGHFTTDHLGFPYLRYRVRQGSHFDRFLDGSHFINGRLISSNPSREERDGSLGRAVERYHRGIPGRLEGESLAPARGYPISNGGFRLDAGYDAARAGAMLADDAAAAEGYALYRWVCEGAGEGAVVELGSGNSGVSLWLAAGTRDSGRGKLVKIDNFAGAPKQAMARTFQIEPEREDGALLPAFIASLDATGLTEQIELHQVPAMAALQGWNRSIRLLIIQGVQGFPVSRTQLNGWLAFVENAGAFAFLEIGRQPEITYLYEEMLAQNQAIREAFGLGGLRILAAR